jgi:transcriptional regulator with XRE-family HTH domain
MAKADLRKAEIDDSAWKVAVGRVIERAKELSGLSLKEFADVVRRDERQIARWFNASERPQFDAIFAVEALRQPLIQALAELAGNVVVETVVRMRRRAR